MPARPGLIVGGVDPRTGKPSLASIHPHGSMDRVPYCGAGSGGYAATSALEESYRPDLTVEEAVRLAQRAVYAGIRNDLGSGSQVDLCVIDRRGKATITRAAIPEEVIADDNRRRTAPAAVVAEEEDEESPSVQENDDEEERDMDIGVNGFGNLPFAVRSVKRILSDDEDDGNERRTNQEEEKWNEILGL